MKSKGKSGNESSPKKETVHDIDALNYEIQRKQKAEYLRKV